MRRRRSTLLIAAALLLVPAPAALAAWPGANGRIAYFTIDSGPGRQGLQAQVRVGNLSGTRARRIAGFPPLPVNLHYSSGIAQWSPSGGRVLFQRVATGFQVTTPRGHVLRTISVDDLWWPAWSADGREIVAADLGAVPQGLVRMRADGSRLRRIPIPFSEHVAHPRWRPGGGWIAYQNSTVARDEVWLVRPDGSGAHMLTVGRLPTWSPDGRRIAFAKGPDVLTVRAGGGGRRRVAAARDRDTIPAGLSWSPDGRRIVFVRQDSRLEHHSSTIITVPAGGGPERVHRVSERFIGSVDWQPR